MRLAATLAVLAATLAGASPALAHTRLVSSAPAANAAGAAPAKITLTFNEKLTPPFSKADVVMSGHDMTVPVKVQFSADGKTMTLVPQARFAKGAYTVKWVAAGADGHRIEGSVPFTVK